MESTHPGCLIKSREGKQCGLPPHDDVVHSNGQGPGSVWTDDDAMDRELQRPPLRYLLRVFRHLVDSRNSGTATPIDQRLEGGTVGKPYYKLMFPAAAFIVFQQVMAEADHDEVK